MPLRFQDTEEVHLAKNMGQGRPQRRLVRGHELALEPGDVVVMDGVPVTSVQRTLLDIAPHLGADELVAIADQIVCEHNFSFGPRKFPMVELEQLRRYIDLHRGARGLRKLQAAIELVRIGADSTPETQLRLLIERSSMPEFVCNFEIKDSLGAGKVAPDLACPQYRTCAEYDGAHHFTPDQQAKDHDRDFITNSLGWHQALINKADMRNEVFAALTKIARMLVRGGWNDPMNVARRSLRGELGIRTDFE